MADCFLIGELEDMDKDWFKDLRHGPKHSQGHHFRFRGRFQGEPVGLRCLFDGCKMLRKHYYTPGLSHTTCSLDHARSVSCARDQMLSVGSAFLVQVRDYFGERIALYFLFMPETQGVT